MTRKTPGRPKKKSQDKAAKNGTRDRKYSITIHDIKDDTKSKANDRVAKFKPDWYLIGDEEYNHQDGHHLHIFLKYKEKKAYSTVLDYFLKFQEQEGLGRVEIEHGQGSFQKCHKYLTNPDKEKKIDDNVIVNVRKLTRQEKLEMLIAKYPDEVRQCNQCSTQVYAGPPVYFTNRSGQRVEIIDCLCDSCHKKKSQESNGRWLRATNPDSETSEPNPDYLRQICKI